MAGAAAAAVLWSRVAESGCALRAAGAAAGAGAAGV